MTNALTPTFKETLMLKNVRKPLVGLDKTKSDIKKALRAKLPPRQTLWNSTPKASVPELLRAGAATYEQRNKLYADNYKRIGKLLEIIYPNGLPANFDADDWNRFGVWFMIFAKSVRYAMNMKAGGHKDSAHDMMVYAAMLEELTK